MARVSRFTPLDRMPAVVIDTETTGLDLAACRIVQISAVRFADGAPLRDEVFDRLVNPETPIPPHATAVHGLTDALVAGAPGFAAVKPELDRFVAGAVLVGQSIGFDLAVLLRETERMGAEWTPPQFLDTKLLAAAVHPEGRELGLDELAAWVGVPIADRHHALGDALVTAAVFAHLIPRLAAAGIRTLGDAEARSNAQSRIRARQAAAGWYDATSVRPPDAYESGRDAPALARLERLAYRHRVEHLMNRSPTIVPPSTALADALRLMADGSLRAILAGDAASGRVDGIVTERDVVTALARAGAEVLARRIETLMSAPVVTVPHDAFVYRAVARMQRLGVGQLPIVDSARRVVGMLSLRDLLRDDAGDAVVIGDRLSTAPTPRALAGACAELPALARRLVADGVPAAEVAAVLAAELRELLARAAVLAEKRMESEGSGRPPVPYAVLALGRVGRGECSLVPEAEHALVFDSGAPDSLEARWFAAFATHLADCLRAAGAAPRAGAGRADDPAWRHSLEGWRSEIEGWAAQPQRVALAAPFFDFRLAYGDEDLAEDLRVLALDVGAAAPALVR
jgi:DNA polymerase-3 subunit epsilon/CBS domain-containing protein